jgi:hypothetical protein
MPMTSLMKQSMVRSCCSGDVRPAFRSARALRISAVCGKEPMVVVGNGGICSRGLFVDVHA